jgi:hypothetical protein
MNGSNEPEITLAIYAKSLGRDTSAREHKALLDAKDAASVEGTTTWLLNGAGARVAAIVPVELVQYARRHGWGVNH